MARKKENHQSPLPDLVCPVYLNIPMITSFIAAVENGFSLETDQTSSTQNNVDNKKSFSSTAKVAEALSQLIGLDAKVQLDHNDATVKQTSEKVVRRHSESSLFIRLRQLMLDNSILESLQYFDDADSKNFDTLYEGKLIEISGFLRRDFLKTSINLYEQFLPYFETEDSASQIKSNTQSSKQKSKNGNNNSYNSNITTTVNATSNNQATDELIKIIKIIKQDLEKSPVQDMVLETSISFEGKHLKVIIPLLDEQITKTNFDSFESIRFGKVTLLGKISAIALESGSNVNLLRRSALGFIGATQIEEMFNQLANSFSTSGIDPAQIQKSMVDPPWIEVLPLALYV